MLLRFDEDRHAYWLRRDDDSKARRCKSVTTIAKIPDDTYSLDLWRRRQTAIGLAMSPPLIERVAAHVEDKKILDAICEEAMTAAGAHQAAGRGTAAHRITETVDAGGHVIETDLSRQVMESWRQLLETAGLTPIPELRERIVVYPDQHIAGKFDAIMRTRDGRNVIVDLKTGGRAVDYPHSIGVQLALYANAPLLAGPVNGRGETTEFTPLTEYKVDDECGYVVHMPEDGPSAVYEIDIGAAWEVGATAAFRCLEWRDCSARDLAYRYEPTVPDPTAIDAYRLELLERVTAMPPKTQTVLRDSWSWPGRTLKRSDGWTHDDLDALATMIAVVRGFPKAARA